MEIITTLIGILGGFMIGYGVRGMMDRRISRQSHYWMHYNTKKDRIEVEGRPPDGGF